VKTLEHVERARTEAVRERIIDKERRLRAVQCRSDPDAVALKSAQVVAVAELAHEPLANRPVAVPARWPVLALQVISNVPLDMVVVE
jgi:hypothetical protein